MARTRYDEPNDGEEDFDDHDTERDYDPDDPETYPAGLYADDSRELVPCPHCGARIDEESEQCPKCGMFLSDEDAAQPRERKSATWVILMLLALLAAIAMALG